MVTPIRNKLIKKLEQKNSIILIEKIIKNSGIILRSNKKKYSLQNKI